MKSRSCGLVQRIGTADSATPHPDPSGGYIFSFRHRPSVYSGTFRRWRAASRAIGGHIPDRSPRYIFSFRHRPAIGLQSTVYTFRRWRAGIEVDWRAHPGSESGTCFRTNRSSRLAPAHQGMKSRSCGLVQYMAECHGPQRGKPPATFSHSAIGRRSTIRHRRWRAGIEVDWRAHPGSESGTCSRTNRSRLGRTPRYEKPELWFGQ